MADARVGTALQEVRRIFGGGIVGGLDDGPLLDRYVRNGDDAAFEALVRRHGRAVHSVCRRLLRDRHDAEDAFQATFLVLARKAPSLRRVEPLTPWLIGVAYRVASKARVAAARRRRREAVAAERRLEQSAGYEAVGLDLGPIVWEEVHRLPSKYRDPILLCCLAGHTQDEAARLLSVPVGTVKGRLHRARETLRRRLTRRGVTAPAAGLAAWLASKSSAAAIPPPLLASTVQAATALAAGGTLMAGTVPVAALLLTQGTLRTMMMTKLTTTLGAVLLTGSVVTGLGAYAASRDGEGNGSGASSGTPLLATALQAGPASAPLKIDESQDQAAKSPDEGRLIQFIQKSPDVDSLKRSRVEAAIASLDAHRKSFEEGTIDIDRYLDAARSLLDSRLAASASLGMRAEAMRDYVETLQGIADREANKNDTGTGSAADLAEARLALAEARVLFAELRAEPNPDAPVETTRATTSVVNDRSGPKVPSVDSVGEPSSVEVVEPMLETTVSEGMGALGSVVIGGGPGGPADDPASQAIIKSLARPVPLNFTNDTPLSDLLAYIKTESTTDGESIPVYVDPIGLNEAEQTLKSPIRIELDGIPLRTSLWLALRQLGLAYTVVDGVLIISSEEGLGSILTQSHRYGPSNPHPGQLPPGMGMGGMGMRGGGFQ